MFDESRVDADAVATAAVNLSTLLEGLVRQDKPALGNIPLVSEQERYKLLVEWNATARELDETHCVHQLFEQQAARTPNAIALAFRQDQITYHELNIHANRLARRLNQFGVGADTLVGVCIERSLELVIGVLAVLKAGGAYVPIDPDYPEYRIAYMIKDCDCHVVITRPTQTVPRTDAAIVVVDAGDNTEDGEDAENLDIDYSTNNLAYLIYTSGSTGTPKGVMIEQRNLLNFFAAMDDIVNHDSPGVWLSATSLSFDISVLELLWTLTRGFKVVIHAEETKRDLYSGTGAPVADNDFSIASEIRRHGVTHFQCTPSMANMIMADSANAESLSALKQMFVGGETLAPTTAERLQEHLTGELYNMYGPTETTIWSSTCKLEGKYNSVPIGKPIANTQIYLLDDNLALAPIGVPGEVYIGGNGVARGYFQRSDLTNDRFVPNPFATAKRDSRLYRTGDMARYDNEGNLFYINRIDNQVKIRGYRIEPGEIEAVFSSHDAVTETAVGVHEAGEDDLRIVAYVVYHFDKELTMSEARRFLRLRLPEYMIPGIIVSMDEIPRTPNGKMDRNALPNPFKAIDNKAAIETPPQTDTEKVLARIWQELLHVECINRTDNFYELGGHSLLAVKGVLEIAEAIGKRVEPRNFFFQTLEQISTNLDTEDTKAGATRITLY